MWSSQRTQHSGTGKQQKQENLSLFALDFFPEPDIFSILRKKLPKTQRYRAEFYLLLYLFGTEDWIPGHRLDRQVLCPWAKSLAWELQINSPCWAFPLYYLEITPLLSNYASPQLSTSLSGLAESIHKFPCLSGSSFPKTLGLHKSYIK